MDKWKNTILNFKIGLNALLEVHGLGLEWEYYSETVRFNLHGRPRKVTFSCRRNKYSGQQYYMSMLPKVYKWIPYEGKIKIEDQ